MKTTLPAHRGDNEGQANSGGVARPPFLVVIPACVLLLGLTLIFASCTGDSLSPQESVPDTGSGVALFRGAVIRAKNIDNLYDAVNDPGNAGKQIVLEPHHYVLDPNRLHGGRLELQQNMSLRGEPGHAESVIIDASGLDAASLTDGFLTGAIRTGRGVNSIEWLTVRGATQGAGAIETDLVGGGRTRIRISNVIATGNQRALDIRNIGATMARRTLEVELTGNVLSDNAAGAGQGLRLVNQNTSGSTIHATLCNNVSRGNIAGGLGANLNSDSCALVIESTADRFEGNGNGWVLLAGIASGAAYANNNSTRFTARGGTIRENGGSSPPAAQLVGGLVAVGGTNTGAVADHVSNNVLTIELKGVTVRGNDTPDIAAWGAWTPVGVLAGTYDRVFIALHGIPKKASVMATPSTPEEPAGTNTVTIGR